VLFTVPRPLPAKAEVNVAVGDEDVPVRIA
jgi:hypothetical protein